ncbi:MAG: hypothetical protein P1V81_01525 [Planctomycetota bacterium]|nr:hypothetical protein [Planctomycetota bacterium]
MSQANAPAVAPATHPKVTVLRLFLGCLIGCLIGFAPGPGVAPGLYVTLLGMLLLLRAPLLPVLGLGIVTKLLSLVTVSVTYQLGVALLDGPTQGLFQTAINAPFLALFGLEYYTVTGGYALGLLLAIAATLILVRGGRAQSEAKPKGVLRPVGVAFLAVLVGGVWMLQSTAAEGILSTQASKGLSAINGATVDIAGLDLDIAEGKLEVTDLAFANPRSLNTDLFRGIELSADVASSDLMRKRLHVERLVVRSAKSGVERAVPGVRVGAPPEPEVPEPKEGEGTIDDYLKDWKVWKERLAQAREWLEKMDSEAEEETPTAELPLGQRTASHLLQGAPSLLVSELAVEGLELPWLGGEVFQISAHNLSSQPSLVDGAMEMVFESTSDLFRTSVTLPSGLAPGSIELNVRNIQVDSITSMLKLGEGSVLRGGTIELSLDGPWQGGRAGYLDMPLDITLRDIELGLSGSKTFPIAELRLPIHVRGPLEGLNLRLDAKALSKALVDAGAKELASFVEAEKKKLIDDGKKLLQDEFDKQIGGKLEELIGAELDIDVTDPGAALEDLEAAASAKLEAELAAAKLEARAAIEAKVSAALASAPKLDEYLSAEELAAFRVELTTSLEADPAADPFKLVQDLVKAKGEEKLKEAAKDAAKKELEKKGLGGLGGIGEKLFGGGGK